MIFPKFLHPKNPTSMNITPPKVPAPTKGSFWKQLGMMILGTTISLALTITTAALLDAHKRAKDRHLSAMLVMSNIEGFARTLEIRSDKMAPIDSIATWLLSKPIEELELLPEKELEYLISQATQVANLQRDMSAENVFSNNIETWKNMGNITFIDLVGQCFSSMDIVLVRFNEWAASVRDAKTDVINNPDNYQGSTIPIKMMNSNKVRASMAAMHKQRCWLTYVAATLRFYNRKNLMSINITEEELNAYIEASESQEFDVGNPPDVNDYYTDPFSPDSLHSLRHLDERLLSLKNEKK